MSEKVDKTRLNIYVGTDLLRRLKYCAEKYGVSHTQMAVMLIGQGVTGLEQTFMALDTVSKDLVKGLINESIDKNDKNDKK